MIWLAAALAGAADVGSELVAQTAGMVEQLGPRPARTPAGDAAQAWTARALQNAGWPAERVRGPDGYVIGCRAGSGPGAVLFLAHTDSVHAAVPGAHDNAAAMAVLLRVATDLATAPATPRTVCLGFPDSEEIGLRGSTRLARSIGDHLTEPLDQVMSLDLVGAGQLTHNGLGPAWSSTQLRAFLAVAPAAVPYVYHAISHGHPELERSDHSAFGRQGIPSSHLMGRGPGGVLWPYHTADDVPASLDPVTLAGAHRVVTAVARAEPLPADLGDGEPAIVVPWLRAVLPGWLVWVGSAGFAMGALFLIVRPDPDEDPVSSRLATTGRLMSAAALGGWAGFTLGAAAGPVAFARADAFVTAGWAGLALGSSFVVNRSVIPTWLVTLGFGALAMVCLAVDLPLLAPPLLVAAFASALGERLGEVGRFIVLPAALWPGLYFVRGDTLRELAHHHMAPPTVLVWAAGLAVLASPLAVAVASASDRVRLGVRIVAGALLVGSLLRSWALPTMAAPYERGPWYAAPWLPPRSPLYPHDDLVDP